MIVNGTRLLRASPIKDMLTKKHRFEGTSHGLAEAGYDIRINQDVHFYPGNFFMKPGIEITSYDNKYDHPTQNALLVVQC